jgi:Lar family restriction alleviation protein
MNKEFSEKLLPCPFCGGKAKLKTYYENIDHSIYCEDCSMGCDEYKSNKEAIAAWNKRTVPRCGECKHYWQNVGCRCDDVVDFVTDSDAGFDPDKDFCRAKFERKDN